MEKNGSNLYFVSFPFSVVVGFFIVFLFIWFSFKTIQLQCFNNSNWIWIFTYLAIILLIVGFFYVFFIPQSLLAFGPYIQVSNWVFIIFSFIVMPIGLRIERNISKNILIHFYKQKAYYIICEFGTVNDKITKLQLPKNIFCNKLFIN